MRICLLRHGETDWNKSGKMQGREDIPLNTAGIEQVKESAEYLKQFNWNIIITSPLSRARMSAEIVSKETGNITIREDADFSERDYGEASGKTLDEVKVMFPDGKWPEAEPVEALQGRTINALLKYAEEYEGNDIIIVSHGVAIKSMLVYLSEKEIDTGNAPLKNASMALLEKIDNNIEILFYNKNAHELKA